MTGPASLSFARAMLVVFAPFACGYFFSYLYRTVNAVVAPDLRADTGVGAAELGLLTSAYFIAFAAAQLPLGVLLDRYGPRRVQAILYAVAALGAVVFSLADDLGLLMLGRALIGLGVSGGLMASLKAIVQWFPPGRVPLVNGWFIANGGLGAMASTLPVEFALGFTDWRGVFVGLAAGTLLVAALIWLVVPDKPAARTASTGEQLRALSGIARDRVFWAVVPLMATCSSSNMAIQGLWAGPWLNEVNGLSRETVAEILLAVAASFAVGGALSGAVAGWLNRLVGLNLRDYVIWGCALYIAPQILIVLRLEGLTYPLWIWFGLTSTVNVMAFAVLARHFPESHIGRANTAANVLVFAMAAGYQFGLGAIIALWPQDAAGHYPVVAYQVAFWAAIATQVAAVVWALSQRRLTDPLLAASAAAQSASR